MVHLHRGVPAETRRPGAAGGSRGSLARGLNRLTFGGTIQGGACAPAGVQLRCVSGRQGGGREWARPAGGGNLSFKQSDNKRI